MRIIRRYVLPAAVALGVAFGALAGAAAAAPPAPAAHVHVLADDGMYHHA